MMRVGAREYDIPIFFSSVWVNPLMTCAVKWVPLSESVFSINLNLGMMSSLVIPYPVLI